MECPSASLGQVPWCGVTWVQKCLYSKVHFVGWVAQGKPPACCQRIHQHINQPMLCRCTSNPISKAWYSDSGSLLAFGVLKRPRSAPIPGPRPLLQTMDDTVCGPERLDVSLISRARSYHSHGQPKIPSSFQVKAGKEGMQSDHCRFAPRAA